MLRDGTRQIEVGAVLHHVGQNAVEVTLVRASMRHWDFPHNLDLLTEAMKEEILAVMKRLIEALGPGFMVKIEQYAP